MAKGYVSIPVGYRRVDNEPLEKNTVFNRYDEAALYASEDPTAYRGQIVSVVENNHVFVYVINNLMRLELLNVQKMEFVPVESPFDIQHDRDGFPTVKCIDNNGNLIVSSVTYTNRNELRVEWNGTFTGLIILS